MGLFDRFTKRAEKVAQATQGIDGKTHNHAAPSDGGIRNGGDVRFCSQCGTILDSSAKFCSECGAPAASSAEMAKQASSGLEYAFLDVETPNRHNDRICSIGVIRTDALGNVIGEKYTLVDPDADFDPINVSIHGITEFDVHGAPSFSGAWEEMRPLVHGAVIVAHNARFDLSVLDKCLTAYGIAHDPVSYACTMSMAMAKRPELGKFKLDTVCEAYSIPLINYHNAMDDAQACKGVFFALGIPSEFMEYVPKSQRRRKSRIYNVAKSETSKAHNELMKHASDVLEDGRVSLEEAIGLRWWLEKNANLSDDPTVTQLIALLSSVLEDGAIDESEEAQLIESLKRIVNPVADTEISGGIEGKKFCLTGDFDYGSKEEVAAHLESLGGIQSKGVTKTCDYVIMGAQGSAAYAHGNYGGKVKKAMEWQSKGVPMQIVSEGDCPWLR